MRRDIHGVRDVSIWRLVQQTVALLVLGLHVVNCLAADQDDDEEGPDSYVDTAHFAAISARLGDLNDATSNSLGPSITPDLFTGTLRLQVAFALPPVRSPAGPGLGLSHSLSASDPWVGAGWSLSMPCIRVKRKLTAEEASDKYQHESSNGQFELTTTSADTYQAQVESGFSLYRAVRDPASNAIVSWSAVDRRGTTHTFGDTDYSRVVDPDSSAVRAWCVSRVEDVSGNFTLVSYKAAVGRLYLERVQYNGFRSAAQSIQPNTTLTFISAAAKFPTTSRVHGFRQVTDEAIHEVVIETPHGIYTKYKLEHEQDQRSGPPKLVSISRIGADGVSFPPLRASYSAVLSDEPPIDSEITIATNPWLSSADGGPWTGSTGGRAAMIDLNGDGLRDFCLPEDGAIRCWIQKLSGFGFSEMIARTLPGLHVGTTSDSVLRYVDLDSDGRTDLCLQTRQGTACWKSDGTSFSVPFRAPKWDLTASANSSILLFADVDGDRRVDICRLATDGVECARNIGDGFDGSADRIIKGPSWKRDSSSIFDFIKETDWHEETHARSITFVDINDDSRADLCGRGRDGIVCFSSSGSGFSAKPVQGPGWGENIDGNWGDAEHGGSVAFTDLDDDNLPEVCARDTRGIVCHKNVNGTYSASEIRGPDWDDSFSFKQQFPFYLRSAWEEEFRQKSLVFVDIDGDGLTDVCGRPGMNYVCRLQSRALDFAGPDVTLAMLEKQQDADWTEASYYNTLRFADVNGDSMVDLCGLTRVGLRCWMNKRVVPRLLTAIRTPQGGESRFFYSTTARTGASRVSQPLVVIHRIEQEDGRGKSGATIYKYANGFYSQRYRDFRGFGLVEISRSSSDSASARAIRRVFYHQGGGVTAKADDPAVDVPYMKGTMYREDTFSPDGGLMKVVETEYELLSSSPPYFAPPSSVRTRFCNGDGCNVGIRLQKFAFDGRTGSLLEKTEYGDLNDPADDVSWRYTYAAAGQRNLLDLVKLVEAFAGASNRKSIYRIETSYDSEMQCVPGRAQSSLITRGRPTETRTIGREGVSTVARFGYDQFGNVVCAQDQSGSVIHTQYDDSGLFVTSVRDPLGHTSQQFFVGVNAEPNARGLYGQPVRIQDANGAAAEKSFDGFGRVIQQRAADGSLTRVEYLDHGDPNRQRARTTSALGLWRETWLDGLGREYLARSLAPQQRVLTQSRHYDIWGNVVAESDPYIEHHVGSTTWSSYTYDSLGRLTQSSIPGQGTTRYCYSGLTTATVDASGRLVAAEYDVFGRRVSTREATGFASGCEEYRGEGDIVTGFKYDRFGRTRSVSIPGGPSLENSFDSLGRRISSRDLSGGRWRYTYDAASRLSEQHDPRGAVTRFEYDPIGRVLGKSYVSPNGVADTAAVRYVYDVGPNAIGRLSKVIDGSGTTSFTYSVLGQVIETRKRISDREMVLASSYDVEGRLETLTYPDGDRVDYEYDGPALSRVKNGKTVLGQFRHFVPSYGPTELEYGNGVVSVSGLTEGSSQNCGLDQRRICSIDVSSARPPYTRFSESYSFDLLGNITTVMSSLGGQGTSRFRYDVLSRLEGIQNVREDRTLTYDDYDNIYPSEESFEYGSGPDAFRLLRAGASRFDSDAAGHIVRRRSSSRRDAFDSFTEAYQYDAEGRLVRATTSRGSRVTFRYDGDGMVVERLRAADRSVFFGKHYECQNAKCIKKIYAGGTAIAYKSEQTGRLYFRHSDRQDSTIAVTDARGQLIGSAAYSALGALSNNLEGINLDGFMLRDLYLGQRYDPVLGMHQLGIRFYDPKLGRFLTPDALLADQGSLRRANPFAYGFNNPAMYPDPGGRCPICIAVGVGMLIGGVSAGMQSGWDFEAVLKGMAVGAAFGAIGYGVGAAFGTAAGAGAATASTSTAHVVTASMLSGAISGVVQAALAGGDVWQGALWGAIGGAVGVGVGYGLNATLPAAESATGLVFRTAAKDSLRGGLSAAIVAVARNQDPGTAFSHGLTNGFRYSLVTNGSGYLLGVASSGDWSPRFVGNALVFKASSETFAGSQFGDTEGITLGFNVVVPEAPYMAYFEFSPMTDAEAAIASRYAKVVTHEMGHVFQAERLGGDYLPTYGASYILAVPVASGSGWGVWNSALRENSMEHSMMPEGTPSSVGANP